MVVVFILSPKHIVIVTNSSCKNLHTDFNSVFVDYDTKSLKPFSWKEKGHRKKVAIFEITKFEALFNNDD
jgi:hypothetical protein